MCGIAGAVWSDPGRALSEGDLAAMMARLVHRGPDDAGVYRDDHAALGFRRLSIVDLAGGHQPLSNEDGTVWTVFNGEIYNFPALRRRLEARGHTLRSSGDTEVLVHLYEDEGTGMFALLRGMFALAIWDVPRRRLVLARDRLGQKPLVYRDDGTRIVFASELKALLALSERDVPRRVDPAALDRYLTYGYVPHPLTILEGTAKLPPAHYAVWQDGRLEIARYWNPDWNVEHDLAPGEEIEQLRATLGEAVREQMIADVPLGAFLSGGIDSTIIVGLMQQASSRPVQTFSIGFDDPAFDESRYAELAAQAPRDRAPRDPGHPPGVGDPAGPGLAVRRAVRRQLGAADLVRRGGDPPRGDRRPDRRRRRRAVRRLRPLPRGRAGRPARPAPRAVRGACWGDRSPVHCRSRCGRRPGSARSAAMLEAIGKPPLDRYLSWICTFDEPARAALYSAELIAAIAAAEPGASRSGRGARTRPGRGLAPRPGHPHDGRRPADVPALRPAGQGRHGEHGAQPRVPRPVPRSPGGRAGDGDADPPQAPAPRRAVEGRAQAGVRRSLAPGDPQPPQDGLRRPRSTAGSAASSRTSSARCCSTPSPSAAACSSPRPSPRWSTSTSKAGATIRNGSGPC